MMNISIGTTSDDARTLNKSYNFSKTVQATVKYPCNILTPSFVIEYDASVLSCNYVSAWNRLYFINPNGGFTVLTGHRLQIDCMVDALTTYRNEISRLNVDVARQENIVEPYLPDEKFIFLDTYDVIGLLPTVYRGIFKTTGTTPYVLAVSGGENVHKYEVEGFEYITTEPADWSTNYINYFINVGTVAHPNMRVIYSAVEVGFIPSDDASNFAKVKAGYDIYRRL